MQKMFRSPVLLFTICTLVGVGMLGLLVANRNAQEAAIPRADYQVKFWGKADSKVVVTQYGDFQCEACLAFYMGTEKTLKEEYADKIRFEYKYLNLNGHRNSKIAAEAAEAASAQGKFWEFHDLLFERQEAEANSWNLEKMVAYAGELGLDTEKFRSEIAAGYYKKAVEVPAKEGAGKGYDSTPTVEINGKVIENPTLENLEAEIEMLLQQ